MARIKPSDSGGETTVILDLPAGQIQRIAKAVVVALVPGWVFAFQTWTQFRDFLEDFIIQVVVRWFVESFVLPVVNAVLGVGALVIETIQLIAFGPDRVLGGSPGLVDAVVWLANAFVAATAGPTNQITDIVLQVNEAIASVAAEAGLFAPIVVTLMWGALLAVAFYVAWSIIRIIDVPFVDIDAIILRVLKPFRFVLRRLM